MGKDAFSETDTLLIFPLISYSFMVQFYLGNSAQPHTFVFLNSEDSFPQLSCAHGRGTRKPLGIIDFQKSIKTNNFNFI